MLTSPSYRIAIIGLGYVGLPLAIEYGKQYATLGFDINSTRVSELQEGIDLNKEISPDNIKDASHLSFTTQETDLSDRNIFIIAVPTDVYLDKKPDFSSLEHASSIVGKYLKVGDIVIYESTVYPGYTEEYCIPMLESSSKLKHLEDFYCGYSPERVSPGDKQRKITDIVKVTSGANLMVANLIDSLYKSIIPAGTYLASSIKIAEASKIVENMQRDINISLMNELVLVFDRLGIDIYEVLDAASTKWNFLNFKPGLVGGHCISVDPYFFLHLSEKLGYKPEVIAAGRKVNDQMGVFIANKLVKRLLKDDIEVKKSSILIVGVTFKENCTDIRNSKVIDIYRELLEFGANVDIYDPMANSQEVKKAYNITLIKEEELRKYEGIIVAVAHQGFMDYDFESLKKNSNSVIFDVKGILKKDDSILRL